MADNLYEDIRYTYIVYLHYLNLLDYRIYFGMTIALRWIFRQILHSFHLFVQFEMICDASLMIRKCCFLISVLSWVLSLGFCSQTEWVVYLGEMIWYFLNCLSPWHAYDDSHLIIIELLSLVSVIMCLFLVLLW